MHKLISSYLFPLSPDFCQSFPGIIINHFIPSGWSPANVSCARHFWAAHKVMAATAEVALWPGSISEPVRCGERGFDKLFSAVFVRDNLKQLSDGKALIEDLLCSKHN